MASPLGDPPFPNLPKTQVNSSPILSSKTYYFMKNLKGLPPEKKLEVLYARIEELESEEQALNEQTAKLLAQARRMIASH